MRKERMDGIASKNRDRPIEENVAIFNEMRDYTEKVNTTSLQTYNRAANSVSALKSL